MLALNRRYLGKHFHLAVSLFALLLFACDPVQSEEPEAESPEPSMFWSMEELIEYDGPMMGDAYYALGVKYSSGWGVPEDDRLAVEWYRKAADAANTSAMFNLGVAYDNGVGVPVDDRLAVEWYRKAADAGNANAMYNLGIMYAEGRGVPQNDVEAYVWSSLSTAFGESKAAHNRDVLRDRLSSDAVMEAQRRASVLFDEISGRVR
ncbi:MAG: tetratricopeptide repeat protein [Phycisphaeraceae bacterium]